MSGNREKQLVKNTFIISLSKIAIQSASFLLLPFYTYILSVEEYGIVDVLNTLVSLGLPIISLQLEQAVFRYLVEARQKKDGSENDIIVTGLMCVTTQCVIGVLICFVASLFFKNEYTWFLAVNIVFAVFAAMLLQISRGLGRMIDYSVASFLGSITMIVVNIICLGIFNLGVKGMLIGNILGQLAIVVFLCIRLKILAKFSVKRMYRKESAKDLRKYALPLVPNELSWWVFNASDRLIVSVILGVGANGILAAASKLPSILVAVYNVFYIGWVESISLHIYDKDIEEYFNRVFNVIAKLFYYAILIMLSFMWFIYPIMINERYDEGLSLIPILAIGVFFDIIVGLLSSLYVAKKDTKAIATTSIMAAVINIVTHLALINIIGLFAAAVSTAVAFTVLALYRAYDIRKKYNIKVKLNSAVPGLAIFLVVICVYYTDIFWLKLFTGIIIAFLATAFLYKHIKKIAQIFLDKIKKNN